MDDARPDEAKPRRGRARTLTITALMGLFIIAVLAALTSRLVPGGLAGILRYGHRQEADGDRERP